MKKNIKHELVYFEEGTVVAEDGTFEYRPVKATRVKGSKGCFAAGTLVWTPDFGQRVIQELKAGDAVFSFNEDGEVEVDSIVEVHHHEAESVTRYTFWGGLEVTATPSHWVLNQYNAFVAIGTLTTDDCILDEMGHLRPLLSVEELDEEPVFNLSVAKNKTYFANGVRVHNQGTGARHPRVRGSKGKSGGGSAPKEDPNTLRSKATVKVLDLISQGEVFGPVDANNPLKSTYFDDTPVMNADGTLNFGAAYMDYRVGTQAQTYMEGFPSASNPVQLNVVLNNANPVIRTVNSNADSLTVTVGVNALFTTNTETGDTHGNSVSIFIDKKPTASLTWTVVLQDTIQGKTMRPYERDYRVPRAGNDGDSWDFRVRRASADDVTSNVGSSTTVNRYVERQEVKLPYLGKAYVGIAADAESTGGNIPKRSYDWKGILCKVPDNYNPVTRVYTGTWTGTFSATRQWTNNPSWVIYDLLTNPVYGLGEFVTEESIDKFSFYDAGVYNDQNVPYTNMAGVTVQGPRFTFNAPIQTQEEAWKLLQAIASSCNSFVGEAAGYITLIQDRPKSVVKLVTKANTIDGKFSYQSSSLLARHTACNVTFNDASDAYLPRTITEQLSAAVTRYGYNPTDLLAYGVTNEPQARRCAKWLLETENTALEVVTYGAAWDHVDTVPGDIIKVMDPDYSGYDYGGRVKTATTNNITLDRTVDHSTPGTYTVSIIHTDGTTVETRTVNSFSVVGGVSVLNVTTLAEAPASESVWVLEGPVSGRQFRVIAQKEEKPGVFTITALQHDPSKYARIENGVVVPAPVYSGVGKAPPSAPTGLQVKEESYFDNQTTRRRLRLNWTTKASDYIVRHAVKWSQDGKAFTTVDNISQPELLLNDVVPGSYSFIVTTFNSVNIASPSASVTYALATGQNGTAVTTSTLKAPTNIGVDLGVVSTRGTRFWAEGVVVGWDDPTDNINMTNGVVDVTNSYKVEFLRPDQTVMYTTTVGRPSTTFNFSLQLNSQKFSTSGVPTSTFGVRVTSIDAFGRYGLASPIITVSALTMLTPANVSLTSGTVWKTPDIAIKWDSFTSGNTSFATTPLNTLGFFKNYRVVVKSGVQTIKTAFVTDREFKFSFSDNKAAMLAAALGSPAKTLTFEVTAFDDFGNNSGTGTITYTVVAPPAATTVTLASGGTTFTSKDVAVKWVSAQDGVVYSTSPLFDNYKVEVLSASSGTILRTYAATNESFAYLFAQNIADNAGVAKPTFAVRVTPTDIFGQTGTSATGTFVAVTPPTVSALQQANLGGTTFQTQDLSAVWTCEPSTGIAYSSYDLFAGYQVKVKSTTGVVVRTALVSTELYSYLFTQNTIDFTTPARSFVLEVNSKDVFGQVSSTGSATFNNPSPAAPAVAFQAGYNIQHFTLIPPNDPDVKGYRIWMSKTPGFTPGDTTLVYDGSDLVGSFIVDPNSTYYTRVASYDYFSKTGLSLSAQVSFSTLQDVKTNEYKVSGVTFTPNTAANTVSWTSGQVYKVGGSSVTVASGTSGVWSSGAGAGGPMFIYHAFPATSLAFSYDLASIYTGNPGGIVTILGVYRGGSDLTQGDGRVLMDGGYLLAQTVGATQVRADSISATHIGANLIVTQAANINDAVITNAKFVNATIETLKLKNGAITKNDGSFALSISYDGTGATPSGQSGSTYKDSGWRNIIQHTITNPDQSSGGPGELEGNVYLFFGLSMSTGLTTSGGGGKEFYDGFNFSGGTHAYRIILEALDMNDGLWYRQTDGSVGSFWPGLHTRGESTNYLVGDRPQGFNGAIRFTARQNSSFGQGGSTTISQGNYYRPNQQFRLTLQARTSIYNQVSTAENFGSFPPLSSYQPFKYYAGLSGSNLVQLNSGVGTQVTYLPTSTQVRNSYLLTQQLYK